METKEISREARRRYRQSNSTDNSTSLAESVCWGRLAFEGSNLGGRLTFPRTLELRAQVGRVFWGGCERAPSAGTCAVESRVETDALGALKAATL